ncbi:hypothetical protein [Planctomycetes bacterium TBK1r]|uniref:Uncharacterized protein n=1 Tax=Stieleria magnilauensis TaxID=2527963 RepID=A0ABX5Y3V3_9BACT|nr:hypothetical protein TBK1r_76520 [Planctomycetes bacterium TBK1r]
MSQLRRTTDRRRRVLYHSHVSPHTPSTPATRRAAAELRAARQPAQPFGSRVHQHLRGRWFSLVPVSRMAMGVTAVIVLAISIALTVLHHAAFTWPTLAYRADLARPLLIHRPDSFAAWWTTMLLLLSAGATRLIYVLRRHRRDDYRGHYQLWQLTLVVLLLASVHATVDLVGWLGASLDLLVGDRAVLSGANWLRIVLDVGGIILAMRLIAEVYLCRPALIAMIVSAVLIGFSELAHWQIVVVDGAAKATLVTAAPMLTWSCFLVAATLYLRSMYRQIRNIPAAPSLRERLAQWVAEHRNRDEEDFPSEFFEPQDTPRPAVASVAPRRSPAVAPAAKTDVVAKNVDDHTDVETDLDENDSARPDKPGWFARLRRRGGKKPSDTDSNDATPDDSSQADAADNDAVDDDGPDQPKPKRRWFGLRAARSTEPTDDAEEAAAESENDSDDQADSERPAKKKGWFSLRLKPQPLADSADQDGDSTEPVADADAETETQEKKKGWFGGLLRRKNVDAEESDDSETEATNGSSKPQSSGRAPARGAGSPSRGSGPLSSAARQQRSSQTAEPSRGNQTQALDDDIDPDDIDWESMSKAERRRMRKHLKRTGRAA